MKRYENLFASGLSLSLTMFLLIFTIYAWYTSNSEVSTSGISASTASTKNVYVSQTYTEGTVDDTEDLSTYGFSNRISITYDGFLSPSSSYDASNYYIPNTIASTGSATTSDGFLDVTSSSGYYISKTLSFCSFEAEDITLYLADISISASDSSTLYKAVRVSLAETSTTIYRCSDGGDAYPVSSISSVSETDPSVSSGSQTNSFGFTINAFNNAATIVSVTLHIWIEGQNSYAVSANDLSAFNIRMSFEA